jgi:hypothetical protein
MNASFLNSGRRILFALGEKCECQGRRPSTARRSPDTPFCLRCFASVRVAACHPQIRKRVVLPPIGMDPGSAPAGALVIRDFLKLSHRLRALTQTKISQAAQINRLEIRALVGRSRCQQVDAFHRAFAVDRDGSSNRGQLNRIPDGSIG